MMNVTIDLKILALAILCIALIVLIIYAIVLLRRLLVTVNHANKILSDMEVASGILAERSQDIDGVIEDVTESVTTIKCAVKEKQTALSATSSVVKAIISIMNALGGSEQE